MRKGTPTASDCRPEAFAAFRNALSRVETNDGLWDAAVAISYHALDDLDVDVLSSRIDELANRVDRRVRTPSFQARWTRLHEVLFDEEGFRGNVQRYYNPLNSYIPAVLVSRRGIPITLSLVYKAVAERVGLQVVGVNAPGHFLIRIMDGEKQILVDPFVGGQVLTTEEALARVSSVIGAQCDPSCLPDATHHQWLARILCNLQYIFAAAERTADLDAMNELAQLLEAQAA